MENLNFKVFGNIFQVEWFSKILKDRQRKEEGGLEFRFESNEKI